MADEGFIEFLGIRKNEADHRGEHARQDNSDFFSRFMFGSQGAVREEEPEKSSWMKILDDVDVDQLFTSIDTLVTAAQELKPYIVKVKPYLDQWIDKNKS